MLVRVALAHPGVPHEVDRLPAGFVAPAIAAPVLLVRGWHVEIDRRPLVGDPRRRDQHRLRQHERRPRHVADVDAAVDTRLVDADRHADAGLRCRAADRACAEHQCNDFFHGFLFMVGRGSTTFLAHARRTGSFATPCLTHAPAGRRRPSCCRSLGASPRTGKTGQLLHGRPVHNPPHCTRIAV